MTPLVCFAYLAVLDARNKIPNTWNRSTDFNRMVAEEKALDCQEAQQKLKVEAFERRAEVKAKVESMMEPSTKPGTGYWPWDFFREKEPPEILDRHDKIMYTGTLAKELRVGACGEMSAVLYRFLHKRGVTGLHYVNMQYDFQAVHTFVVIGAKSIMQEKQYIKRTEDAVAAFGQDAIICDPWLGDKGEVFLVNGEWEKAVQQMIDEVDPQWTKEEITFGAMVRSNSLTREQKVDNWNKMQQK